MTFSARLTAVVAAILIGVACLLSFGVGASRGEPATKERGAGPVEGDAATGGAYAADGLIVTYEPGTTEPEEDEAAERAGGRIEEEIEPLNAAVVALPEAEKQPPGEARKRALERAKEKLEAAPNVASVEYDKLRTPSYTPNDPSFTRQWGLKLPGFPAAWDREDGDGSAAAPGAARIAVVDSGVQAAHPDLKGKVVAQRDFVNGDAVAEDNSSGHGTHVSGVAAATTRNSRGVAGGCPDCKLLGAKVLDAYGNAYSSDIAQGIIWSADNGAKVINLSLGGPGAVQIENDAVDYAISRGAVVVGAAGNNAQIGNEPDYPAAHPPVVAVAATDRYDKRAAFSNHGGYVDAAAPGVGIYSTVPGGYGSLSGTSQATPHVAALAGMLAAQGRTGTEITSRITATAKDLGPVGRDPYYGAGRINAAAAVR